MVRINLPWRPRAQQQPDKTPTHRLEAADRQASQARRDSARILDVVENRWPDILALSGARSRTRTRT